MREHRKLRREQRQQLGQERLKPKGQVIPPPQKFYHRDLEIKDYDYPEVDEIKNHEPQSTFRNHRKYGEQIHIPRHQSFISGRRQFPVERQAGIFATTSTGFGLAWFASLLGLAAMVREPLSTVFGGINIGTQLLNSKYLLNN